MFLAEAFELSFRKLFVIICYNLVRDTHPVYDVETMIYLCALIEV